MYDQKTLWQFSVIALLLIVAACSPTFFPDLSDDTELAREAVPAPAAKAGKTAAGEARRPKLVGEFAAGPALQQLFGNYDAATKLARWRPDQSAVQELGFSTQPRMVYTHALFAGQFVERQQARAILLLKTLPVPDVCRGCSPAIGAALYTRQADGWELNAQRLNVANIGAFDQLSKARLVKFGADKHGVLVNWSFTNLGFAEEGALLVAGSEQGLRQLLSINMGGNNAMRCRDDGVAETTGCWSYRSTLEFVPVGSAGQTGDYYELRVVTTGSKPNDAGEIGRLHERKTYRFHAGAYQLQSQTRH